MRILKLLSVILLTLGMASCSLLVEESPCGPDYEPIPGYINAGQIMIGDYYDAERTSVAMDIFYDNWTDDLKDYEATERVLSNLCIEWEPYPWVLESLGSTEDGLPKRVSGLTESPRDILVWIGDPDEENRERKIAYTAFFHEIVHTMLWDLYNEPDPEHEDDVYDAWKPEHTQVIRDSRAEALQEGV